MAGTTTAMTAAFRGDVLSGLHCFNANQTFTATAATTATYTSVSALTGLAVGMTFSGTNVAAGSVIASIDSGTQFTSSKASSGTVSGTLTAVGDSFRMALIKVTPTGTYGSASTNYTDITGNTDEVTGTGYTAAGIALTGQASPVISGTTAFVDWTVDPSWTSATISTTGCMIYNNSRRGPVATRACSIHDFGGTQTVTAGTLTIVLPVADSSNAIIRFS